MTRHEPLTLWLLVLLTVVTCLGLVFAVIGFFDWLGLMSMDIQPCPCREQP